MVIAYVGSGGQTTLLKRRAQEYLASNLKVFITTSTRMYIEPDTLLTDDAQAIIRRMKETGRVMAGMPHGEKFGPLPEEVYRQVCREADVVLVEADGSKGLPLKFPNAGEPVIYDNVDEIIVVCGLQAIGKPARQVCHRLELVKECLKISDETIITVEHIQTLVHEGYVRPLREKYPQKHIIVQPNHDGSPEQASLAQAFHI